MDRAGQMRVAMLIEATAERKRAADAEALAAKKELGELFARVIADDALSLKEMAAVAGVSRTTAYSLARGTRKR
jgi:predicted XRE-type DNA-binding protein